MKHYALLLAGGGGKRLWPFSREHTPKQFVTLPTGKTLLETTLDRIRSIPDLEKIIVTTNQYSELTRTTAQAYNAHCFIEPESRNTAPAIAWSLRELRKINEDAVIVIMPTDHIIARTDEFNQALSRAIAYAEGNDKVLLFGSPQNYITTRFGFIAYAQEKSTPLDEYFSLYPISKFHEKPSHAEATHYKEHINIVWNMGIFVGRLSVLWALFEAYAPHIVNNLDNYNNIIPQAFDHAILERAHHHLMVLPYDFGWNDIGSLDEFIPALHHDKKKYIELAEAHNNSVAATKSVILAGVSDLVVIEMDDMILITRRDIAQSPELITHHMRHHGWEKLL